MVSVGRSLGRELVDQRSQVEKAFKPSHYHTWESFDTIERGCAYWGEPCGSIPSA